MTSVFLTEIILDVDNTQLDENIISKKTAFKRKRKNTNNTAFSSWYSKGNRAPICPSSSPLAAVMQAIMGKGGKLEGILFLWED